MFPRSASPGQAQTRYVMENDRKGRIRHNDCIAAGYSSRPHDGPPPAPGARGNAFFSFSLPSPFHSFLCVKVIRRPRASQVNFSQREKLHLCSCFGQERRAVAEAAMYVIMRCRFECPQCRVPAAPAPA